MAEGARPRTPGGESGEREQPRFRRREDHAVALFREAMANLADIRLVDRILLELGRFYDPLAGGTIVDLRTRIVIVEALRAGRTEEARRLLDDRLARYTRVHTADEGERQR